jgi:hypothetical protein
MGGPGHVAKVAVLACTVCGQQIPLNGPAWVLYEGGSPYGLVYCLECVGEGRIDLEKVSRAALRMWRRTGSGER